MLDQNTDRMWYVIGAVLIGAAIIFGMNTLMPNAFASVTEIFEVVSSETTERILDITPYSNNVLSLDMVGRHGVDTNIGSGATLDRIEMRNRQHNLSGLRLFHSDVNYKPNTTYLLSYGYEKTHGTLVGFGGHLGDTYSSNLDAKVYVDDVWNSDKYQTSDAAFIADTTDLYNVKVYFTTPDVVDDLFRIEIQPNRGFSEPDVSVIIHDLSLVEVGSVEE